MQHLFGDSGYVHNAYGLAMALVAVLSLGAGVWVVLRERGRRVSLSLLAGSVAIAVYLLAFSYLVRSTNAVVAHRWAHVAYLGVPFIVPALYHFSMDLLGLWRQRTPWIQAAWAVGFVYMALAQGTSLLVPGVIRTEWGFYSDLTLWNIPFVAWSLLLLVLAILDYWTEYRRADATQRARIRWLAIPLVIASVGFIDYGPSLGIAVPPLGFAFLAVFPLAAAWVVARYHLPDLTPAFAADQILATMAEPLLVVDGLGRVAISNPAAARLLGWAQQELKGASLSMLLGAETAGQLTGARMHGQEMEIEARTGEPIAVSVSTNDLVVAGRGVGTVIVARDIRDRRRAAKQLERREQHFRALIENARDTITILDGEGRVMYQSPSHEGVLSLTPGEHVGRSVFIRVHPDDLDPVTEQFTRLVAEPNGTMRAEVRMLDGNGEYRVMDVLAHNLLEHPAVKGVVVNGRDVTEEHRLAERLQEAQKMEAIGRLAGGIAHDFNNVLTTIQGNVALLEEERPGDPALRTGLEAVRQGADRAARLTSQLLAFSRRQVTRPEVLDPGHVVEELRPALERAIGENRLVVGVEADAGHVRVDRDQLEQALVDLAMNSRDAMGRGGRLEIGTGAAQVDGEAATELGIEPGRYVRITVSDDGEGMDERTRLRIFEPFFTTKDVSVGSGLGLSTVYGTVRQAAGHINVESEPGRGARFSIYLPRVELEEDPAVVRRPGPGSVVPGAGGSLVLVVEDEAPVRELITRVLERKGYSVLSAPNGSVALELAHSQEGGVDLLISDLVMPGLSGWEVAERLGREYPGMATILISGYTADEMVRDGIGRGEYVFLPKPFDPATLTRQVAEVLGVARAG